MMILVVSFGTSYPDSLDNCIGAVENAIRASFPEDEVRRAFTSQVILRILKKRDNMEIAYVKDALERALSEDIREMVIQPTHLMDGLEYMKLMDVVEEYRQQFERIVVAKPLLMDDSDFDAVASILADKTVMYDDGETAICFMGHGTEAKSNEIYRKLQEKFSEMGRENYYIGTVEAEPSLDEVISLLHGAGIYKKVLLEPLMLVSGDHVHRDMAGDQEHSWKSRLEGEGYDVTCILEGIGQIPEIQQLYAAHTMEAVKRLKNVEEVRE